MLRGLRNNNINTKSCECVEDQLELTDLVGD